jgi:predicted ATP-grasp superfamily ATP-dependent carboligase
VKTQKKLPYAIVIGIDCITGLQSARILAQHGVPVIGLAKDPKNFCCKTKVCERILQVNTASEDLIVLLESLGTTLHQKAVLFPCTDMSVLTLSRHRRRLADKYHIALPEPEVVEMLMDKVSFYTYAQQNDFPIPKTFFLKNRVDAEAAAEQLSFPCIMKPPIKTPTWESNTRAKVFKVNDQKEFLVMYDQCSDWADLLMVQEWIDGNDADLYSCNCYFNTSSEPLVTFIARKLRQWPPETGTSCLGEECRNDVVLETSIRLLQSVNYHGLGYVEMKRDQRTGQHFIIEPNIGRPTGRSAIAEAGGVEILYTKYCDLANLPLPANREQKYEGVKWIYLMHDIQSSFYYWRRGELTFREWWRSIRGPKYFAVLSWNDPAPFWNHFWGAFLLVIKTQISRLVRNRKTSGAGFASTTGENP